MDHGYLLNCRWPCSPALCSETMETKCHSRIIFSMTIIPQFWFLASQLTYGFLANFRANRHFINMQSFSVHTIVIEIVLEYKWHLLNSHQIAAVLFMWLELTSWWHVAPTSQNHTRLFRNGVLDAACDEAFHSILCLKSYNSLVE